MFTPDRTGGDLPHSLGHPYLAKGAIDEWRRQERDRHQLPLIPQLDMAVERTTPARRRLQLVAGCYLENPIAPRIRR
jgi:hypothetical protein